MIKLLVKKGFVDKNTNIYHSADDIVEYPEARAKEIEKKGFGEILNEPKPTKKAEAKEEPKAKTAKKK